MIIELLGRSGCGKTTICKELCKYYKDDIYWPDGFWYSQSKIMMYLRSIPSLFNPRLWKLIYIGNKTLLKRHIINLRQIRHLIFHFNIVKLGLKMQKKYKIILFSESYSTLIPNFFINNFSREEEKFISIVGKEFYRDIYFYIFNDISTLMNFKNKRDGTKTGSLKVDESFADLQERNLNIFVSHRCKYSNYHELFYKFDNKTLEQVTNQIIRLINNF